MNLFKINAHFCLKNNFKYDSENIETNFFVYILMLQFIFCHYFFFLFYYHTWTGSVLVLAATQASAKVSIAL